MEYLVLSPCKIVTYDSFDTIKYLENNSEENRLIIVIKSIKEEVPNVMYVLWNKLFKMENLIQQKRLVFTKTAKLHTG